MHSIAASVHLEVAAFNLLVCLDVCPVLDALVVAMDHLMTTIQ